MFVIMKLKNVKMTQKQSGNWPLKGHKKAKKEHNNHTKKEHTELQAQNKPEEQTKYGAKNAKRTIKRVKELILRQETKKNKKMSAVSEWR